MLAWKMPIPAVMFGWYPPVSMSMAAQLENMRFGE